LIELSVDSQIVGLKVIEPRNELKWGGWQCRKTEKLHLVCCIGEAYRAPSGAESQAYYTMITRQLGMSCLFFLWNVKRVW